MSIYRKNSFLIPEHLIYLDGNSLGPLTKASQARIDNVVKKQWGQDLITSWNKHDWFNLPETVGIKIAKILKAQNGSITVCDSTSINLYKLLHAAIRVNDTNNTTKNIILTDNLNFPTDLYIAQGIINSIHSDYKLKIIDTRNCEDPTQLIQDNIDDSTAIVMLTHVGYDTGYAYNISSIAQEAKEYNCQTIWDFSHSIGALNIDLDDLNVDFAVGCTYKYLNGGPGAPAFLYVNPRHQEIQPPISGWMGQDKPFGFDIASSPDSSIRKYRVGTPHILSLASLDAALSLFEDINMNELEDTAQNLLDKFMAGIETTCPSMDIISPQDKKNRGTQLVLQPRDNKVSAYAIMQNLIDRNVIGDFRQPNSCRFGITPLYISESDINRSVSILADILISRSWNQEKYFKRDLVT